MKDLSADSLLFPSRSNVKVALCYNSALCSFRNLLSLAGLEGETFTLHSPRVGGLSEAANSGEVSDSALQRQVGDSSYGSICILGKVDGG